MSSDNSGLKRMRRYGDETLRQLTEPPWFGIGKDSAASYACNKDWLFRRVETIEFVGPRSVRRSISVDFEVPKRLPDLGERAAKGTALVPISALQKWPPLMDFHLLDPAGQPTSRYLRTTNKKLDFGLLLGMADLTLALGAGRAERKSWEMRKRSARKLGRAEPERLGPTLRRELAAVVQNPRPSQSDVAHAVNELGAELERRLSKALERERFQESDRIATQIAATVDLAARLGDSSILWVAVQGTPGTDRIVKFSYLGAYRESMPQLPEETGEQVESDGRPRRTPKLWKGLSIRCSWRRRTLIIPLPHTGRHVRYHLDVRAPEGGVELLEAKAMAFPPATADDGDRGRASVRSVASLARRYPGLDVPDEWVGPQSGGFYMDYGKPIPLASTSTTSNPGREEQAEADAEASAEIIDRRAHVYLGASGAPSHRVLLQVKLAATRNGFIQGCMIATLMVAVLMWISYFNLTSAALHLEPTVVLLSVVPVVLGYVLVRPNEQALERYHVSGVRAMALLSGAMPIVGALTLVLTHRGIDSSPPDLAVVRPIWCVLAVISALTAAGLIVSWKVAAPSKTPTEDAADSDYVLE